MVSTASKIAAHYECDAAEIPKVLWRVRYTGQSLKARAKPSFKTKEEFKTAVERHLNWSNRMPTPFVSLFGSRDNAVKWARRHLELGYDDVFLLKVNASKLGSVFRVRYLVEKADIHTVLPEKMYNDEFLVLRKISRWSILRESYLDDYLSEDSELGLDRSRNESDGPEVDTFKG